MNLRDKKQLAQLPLAPLQSGIELPLAYPCSQKQSHPQHPCSQSGHGSFKGKEMKAETQTVQAAHFRVNNVGLSAMQDQNFSAIRRTTS